MGPTAPVGPTGPTWPEGPWGPVGPMAPVAPPWPWPGPKVEATHFSPLKLSTCPDRGGLDRSSGYPCKARRRVSFCVPPMSPVKGLITVQADTAWSSGTRSTSGERAWPLMTTCRWRWAPSVTVVGSGGMALEPSSTEYKPSSTATDCVPEFHSSVPVPSSTEKTKSRLPVTGWPPSRSLP